MLRRASTHPALSIVIVTWNSASEIGNCLSSLFGHDHGLELEIFAVDNASQDQTTRIIREVFPQVHLIENTGNVGFSAANNQAIHVATASRLLVLNPDTICHEGSLKRMVEYLDSRSSVGAVGPRLVRPDGEIQKSCFRSVSFWSVMYGYFFGGSYLPAEQQKPSRVQALSGAALMVKREVLGRVGMLDTDYFMYGEDNDWCYRIRQAGYEIHYLPTAEIVHLGGRSARLVPVDTYVRRHVAKLIFASKHRSPWEVRALKHLMQLNIHLRALRTPRSWSYYKEILAEYDRQVKELETNLHPL